MTDPTQKSLGHGCPAGTDHDREVPEIDLLSPLTIRGVSFRNRIVQPLNASLYRTSKVPPAYLI